MVPDTFDDGDIAVPCSSQISPGCPTAGAVLDGNSTWRVSQNPAPALAQRTEFPPITPLINTRNPWALLRPGLLVLFQLDKRELARQLLVPEGTESFERCLAFPTKRYIGLVVGSFRGERDSDAQEYVIAFVSKTLPPASGPSAEPDSFTVPIAPTKQENVNGRQPLHPKPFPWTGCYQYTVFGTRIVPTHTYPSAIEYKLSEEDLYNFDTFAMADRATLAFHRDSTSPTSDEKEVLLFENMKILDTMITLPVKVWQELTREQQGCHDPREFVEEALDFRELALRLVGAEEPSH